MTEDFAKRILVVLDRNYLNNRSEEEYNNIHNIVNTVFGEEYKVEFDVFQSFLDEFCYDTDVDNMLSSVDKKCNRLLIDDYACVIVEGVAAWFYLHSMYDIPMVCINPTIDLVEEFSDYMSDEDIYSADHALEARPINTEWSWCIFNKGTDEYDDVFYDSHSKESVDEITDYDFWMTIYEMVGQMNDLI